MQNSEKKNRKHFQGSEAATMHRKEFLPLNAPRLNEAQGLILKDAPGHPCG